MSATLRRLRFETLAVHAAADPDPTTGAVAPAIHLSTTFERAPDGSFPSGYAYIRDGNPNRSALERALALIEGGASAVQLRAPDLEPDPALPADTRLWAALQHASGGVWGGCVYDPDAIIAKLAGAK